MIASSSDDGLFDEADRLIDDLTDAATRHEQDDLMGTVVAVLRAMQTGDRAGADVVMGAVDHTALAGFLLGMAGQLGSIAAGGPERFGELLAAWQPGARLGDLFAGS